MCGDTINKMCWNVNYVHWFLSLLSHLSSVQVFAEKMGLETGWNCHISLTPNGDSPCDGAPASPSQGFLHEDLNQGNLFVETIIILFKS